MTLSRRAFGTLLVGSALLHDRAIVRAQDPPNRREFTITARDFQFSPDRLEVVQNDLVKLTVRSEDIAYSFTIDEYRLSKRIAAGASTTFEFRTDRTGTFRFYSNLSNDAGHRRMQGQLIVRAR